MKCVPSKRIVHQLVDGKLRSDSVVCTKESLWIEQRFRSGDHFAADVHCLTIWEAVKLS